LEELIKKYEMDETMYRVIFRRIVFEKLVLATPSTSFPSTTEEN
jgi:hypothetical protein